MKTLTPDFGRLYAGLRQSAALEKLANESAPEQAADILVAKAANDSQTFELAKSAGFGSALMEGAKQYAPTFAKGLAGATGVAIPLTIAGNMMSTHAAEEARNKALQTGAGLAAIGGTMYGLHRALGSKQAADEAADLQDAITKLASVGYLDEMLGAVLADGKTAEETKKLAGEIRLLNREFAVEILRNLAG